MTDSVNYNLWVRQYFIFLTTVPQRYSNLSTNNNILLVFSDLTLLRNNTIRDGRIKDFITNGNKICDAITLFVS